MTKRFQLDLTEAEHAEMTRLMGQAGIKTKREFVSAALTLFRWAANELLYGRVVAAVAPDGGIRQLEMPALATFAAAGQRVQRAMPGVIADADRHHDGPVRPARETVEVIRQAIAELSVAIGAGRTGYEPLTSFFPPRATPEEMAALAGRKGKSAAQFLADLEALERAAQPPP